jgi:hypothetical protein
VNSETQNLSCAEMSLVSLVLTAGALIAPMQRPTGAGVSCASRTPGPSMIRIAKKGSAWDDLEKEMLDSVGLGETAPDAGSADESELEGAASAKEAGAAPSPPPTPRRGEQPWGHWSHEGEEIELSLALPPGTSAKELSCTVTKEQRMVVEAGGAQLLAGTLALPVDRADLSWLVETLDDGSKLLCIELPLLPIDTSGRSRSVDCIFDESLVVNGEPCRVPGLSGVAGKA